MVKNKKKDLLMSDVLNNLYLLRQSFHKYMDYIGTEPDHFSDTLEMLSHLNGHLQNKYLEE